jgi:hypothetical protein
MAEKNPQTPKTTKSSLITRAKKNVGGKMATSFGKKALPKEARSLLKSFKIIVEKEGGKKKAEEIDRNIMKLLVKMKIHVDNKSIDLDDFIKADKPIRQAFEIIYDCFDYYQETTDDRAKRILNEKFAKAEALLREAEVIVCDILRPHLQQKSLDRLHAVFNTLGSATFLKRVWEIPNLYDELFQLVNAMNKYTQFHFY